MAATLPSPEARLLLDTVCAPGPAAGGPPPATRVAGLNWLAVAQLAEREKLLGVLWPALSASQGAIPEDIAGAMRRQALVSEFRMAALEARLREVVQLLHDHGIPVMLMKGSALAVIAYGSFARRPMGDLDLLVHETQVGQAWDLLRKAGWLPEVEGADAFYETHRHVCPLVAPGGANVIVELHRCLLYPQGPFHLPEREVWEAATPVEVGGCPAWVPDPAHLVLHLCIHFAWSHQMQGGLSRTVRDLGVLSPLVDWDRVVELAHTTHAESCCYWTLLLATSLSSVPVPRGVLQALQPRSPRWLLGVLRRVITAQALDPRQEFTPSLRLGHLTWELAIRPEAAGHGADRPWAVTADFAKLTHAAPAPTLLRRLEGQVAHFPRWAHFVAVAAGFRWPSKRRLG